MVTFVIDIIYYNKNKVNTQ